MLWCEPPQKLENVLKYHFSHTNRLPLISIAQINYNNDNPNDNTSIDTTTESVDKVFTTTILEVINTTLSTLIDNETSSTNSEDVSTQSSDKSYHPHGTEIIFKCIPGMNGLKNTWKITCEDGGWIGRALKCGNYLNFDIRENGIQLKFINKIYDAFNGIFGQIIKLFSKIEDDIQSSEERKNKSCTYLNSDPNVWAFIGDQRINEYEELPAETELIIRCKDIGKYNLIGSRRRKCLYGEWDGEKPACFGLSQENDYARMHSIVDF